MIIEYLLIASSFLFAGCQDLLSVANSTSPTEVPSDSLSQNDTEPTTTEFLEYDFEEAFKRNSSSVDEVVLTCSCVSYFQCDPKNILVPQLNDDNVWPRIRIQMENCSDSEQKVSQVCCSQTENSVSEKAVPEFADRCGVANRGGVAGQEGNNFEAAYAEFPWVAAVLQRKGPLLVYQCGGSIIDMKVIVTAAHCVSGKNVSSLKVRAGEWDSRNTEEFFSHQDRSVEKVIIHEDYNQVNLNNDIALLILDEPLVEHINVGRICLPPHGYRVPDGNITCYSTGWGKSSYDKESLYKNLPKKVPLTTLSWKHCQQELRNTRLGRHFRLHQSFVCAWDSETQQDTCTGDGGSPLMCTTPTNPGKYQLLGMVSWGISCNKFNPGVYVNVPLFRMWIGNHLTNLNLNKP